MKYKYKGTTVLMINGKSVGHGDIIDVPETSMNAEMFEPVRTAGKVVEKKAEPVKAKGSRK